MLSEFEARLRYAFERSDLLDAALAHPSHRNEHPAVAVALPYGFEELAFLGDAVLSLAVALTLMPGRGGTGEMTKARAAEVKNARLAVVADALRLPLRLGEGESRNLDARAVQTRMSTGFEAVVGAIYLDAGPEHAMRVAQRLVWEAKPAP